METITINPADYAVRLTTTLNGPETFAAGPRVKRFGSQVRFIRPAPPQGIDLAHTDFLRH